ncbi:MAG: hypothetical protein O3B64_02690 [bacterium]|nr:hypothetical protein [bacterium]
MKKSPLNIVFIVVFGAIVLVFAIIAVTMSIAISTGSKPTKAAKTFTETVANGDMSTAYTTLASDAFRANTSREEFDAFLTLNPILTHMSDIRFNGFESSGGQALVYGTIDGAGEVSPIRVLLENDEELGWLISGVDFSEQLTESQ